jgi:hypothetical protein
MRLGKAVEVCCVLLRQGQVGLGMAVEVWPVAAGLVEVRSVLARRLRCGKLR